MPRVRRGFKARRRRNKVMKHARGYYGARGKTFRSAIAQVHHAWQDAYRHRKTRKREYRRLWIARINAGARLNGTTYSRLIPKLNNADVRLNRKVLADLAMNDPSGFKAVVDAVK